jgi:hypothetical protein
VSTPVDLARYAWADADDQPDGLALLFVRPVPTRPAAGLRVIAELPRPLTFGEAQDEATKLDDFAWGSELLQADQVLDWAVFVEPWGWATSLSEIVAGTSKGGSAISVFWNVNAVMRVVVARDGQVVREFDPLIYDDGGAPMPEEVGLPFGEVGPSRGAALVVAERLTGVALTKNWLLERRRPTYRIALPPSTVE